MKIKEIFTQLDLHELGDICNQLLQKSGSNNIFSTFEWLYTWWEHFGQDKKLFILLALEGDEIIWIAGNMDFRLACHGFSSYRNFIKEMRTWL